MSTDNLPVKPRSRGFFVQPRAYLSDDRQYLTLLLPGNIVVRKHVNYFKRILGIPYEPKPRPVPAPVSQPNTPESSGGGVA